MEEAWGGGSKDLMQEKNGEYTMIEVHREGYIDGPGLDIILNRQDIEVSSDI